MSTLRIIPRLDIKGPNLVKGIHLEGLRVLGKPQDFALKYYQSGADELLYMDIVASLYGRNNLLDIVRKTAEYIFIPLTVGGGVRTLEDIRILLRAGADKVAINTAAIKNPNFIREASLTFGSQCIVVSIEAKKMPNGTYEAFTDNGRERTGRNVYDWAKEVVTLGAGELLITSIDKEGTAQGFDIELVHEISKNTPIPVIACGGAGKRNDFLDVIKFGKIDAVCAASIFHYRYLKRDIDFIHYQQEGNIEFLKNSKSESCFMQDKIASLTIQELKRFLSESGIYGRIQEAGS